MKIFGYNINFNITNKDEKMPPDSNTTRLIKFKTTLQRVRQDLQTWRTANIQAENFEYPDRTQLLRLYKDVDLDAHLTAAVTTRKNAILGANFIVVDKEGKENEDLTDLVRRKWFYDFVSLSLDSIYWGFSLIQFGDLINDEFVEVELVERRYVRPEFGTVSQTVIGRGVGNKDATSFLESPFKEWNLGIGGKRDLGLYLKAAPLILWKKGALSAWAEYTELFGTPMRIGRTNVRDETTRQNMFNTLKEMGTSLFSVIDKNDEIEIVEADKGGNGQDIFDFLIARCNSEISKLILNQTGTMDEKSFSGSANVHERVLKSVHEADKIMIENVFTYQLVPFLNEHELGFEGHKIIAEPDDELSLKEKSDIDLKLLDHYNIPVEYIEETYGTPVEDKPETNSIKSINDKLDALYPTQL